jgi:hypothetical protein
MEYIRQINSIDTESLVIIVSEGYEGNLENHPSILEHPELFEISNEEITKNITYLNYQ